MNIFGNSTIPNVISISNPSVTDHVVTYSDVSGLNVKDSGVTIGTLTGSYLKLDGTNSMQANLNFGGYNVANCPNLIGSSKTSALNDILTSSTGVVVDSDIPVFNSTTGRILKNSSIQISSLATTASLSSYVPYSGATGTLAMGTNAITGSGANTAGTLTLSGSTASTSVSSGTLVLANASAGLGVGGKAFIGDRTIIGPAQTMAVEHRLCIRGVNGSTSTTGSHMCVYTDLDQYALFELYNTSHDNIALMFDSYHNGVAYVSSSSASNYQIAKTNNRLQFITSTGFAQGATISSQTTAGYIDTAGILQWQKPIVIADATASTSSSSGSLINGGGFGNVGKAYIGSNAVIGATQTMAVETKLTVRGAATNVLTGPTISTYTAASQYPLLFITSWANDDVSLSFDFYFDGTNFRSSYAGSNYQIKKNNNQLRFDYNSGTAAGSIMSWSTAGYIDTVGILQWQKPIVTSDATNASSTSTGAIIASSGGLGVGGRAYIGGMFHALSDVSLCGTAGLGSGSGVIGIVNRTVAPSTNPSGGGVLYAEAGALKWRGSSGTVSVLGPA